MTTGASSPPASSNSDERVEAARRDLVSRFGYDASTIRLVSIEPVTWPNAALGCPETDKHYSQVTVEGYRIVLAWKDLTFNYHGENGRLPFLCQFLER